MNKDILIKIKDKEDRLLLSNVLDKYKQYETKGYNTYTYFLNERNLKFVSDYLNYLNITFNIYKAHDLSEKYIIYFGKYDDFISIYRFKNNNYKNSDVLGALFNILKIDNLIGDIFINDNYVYITSLSKYNFLIENELYKVGRYEIEIEKVDEIIDITRNFIDINLNLNSLRLDLLIAKLSNLSRSKVNEFSKEKNIYVNYKKINDRYYTIKEQDVISIQSVGKFIINKIEYKENKNKYYVSIKKYN